jgi:hypothetical protein
MAKRLGETAHCSPLLRKARRHGISTVTELVQLAVARGCSHYAGIFPDSAVDPGLGAISDEELVTLLLLGEHPFEPFAVRCAAQLLTSCDGVRLARLAERERVARALSYIVEAALAHDPEGAQIWRTLRAALGTQRPVPAGRLPHWSRFVSQTGVTRRGPGRIVWLTALR